MKCRSRKGDLFMRNYLIACIVLVLSFTLSAGEELISITVCPFNVSSLKTWVKNWI
jgi:hypothetical protein